MDPIEKINRTIPHPDRVAPAIPILPPLHGVPQARPKGDS